MTWDKVKKALSGKMTPRQKIKILLQLDAETRQWTSHEDERIASFLESQRCLAYTIAYVLAEKTPMQKWKRGINTPRKSNPPIRCEPCHHAEKGAWRNLGGHWVKEKRR